MQGQDVRKVVGAKTMHKLCSKKRLRGNCVSLKDKTKDLFLNSALFYNCIPHFFSESSN